TFDEIVQRSTGPRRLQTTLLALFAGAAALLAMVGVYGVTAYSVVQRTREIGVRMALGADRSQILQLVLQQNLRPVATGVAFGIMAAALSARFLSAHLFGISALDPTTYMGVALAFAATALFACWIPARRAATVEPVTALRVE
ncbi:MAG TPA: FtsX-like permease family protein, partial [Chthoniobacterales bacterium]|nr:FtsX-like permease family protein [Chthoniobacterales bacterium]